jgi:hypothetical protein
MAIIINDWDKYFENSQSKRWENLRWVPIPNKQGLGYKKIMQQKNGAEIFGCWIAMVECASRQNPRGIIEMSIEDLSLETMINHTTLLNSITYLSNTLHWVCVDSEQTMSAVCARHTSPPKHGSILFNSILTNSSVLKEEDSKGETKIWRDDIDIYFDLVKAAHDKFKKDPDLVSKHERLNPNVDILLTVEKAVVTFWGTEAGWKHKKKSRTKEIDMVATLINSISQQMNKVYKPREKPDYREEQKKKEFNEHYKPIPMLEL